MAEYDVTTSYLFRQFPKDFVEWLFQDGEFVELADTSLKQTRYPDAVARAKVTTPDGMAIEILVHIEFQTDADDEMPRRMVGYIGRIIDAYDTPVISAVVYLRPQKINDPGIYHYALPTYLIITYLSIKICELDLSLIHLCPIPLLRCS